MNINEILDLSLYQFYSTNSLNLILKLWLKYTWSNYDYLVLKTETVRDAVELNTLVFFHSSPLKFSTRQCFPYNMHEYLWNLTRFIKFNYECDAQQITKILPFIVLWECKLKIFENSRGPQLITLADHELYITTLKNTEYITADQSRC